MQVVKKFVATAALVSAISVLGAGSSFATTLQTSAGELGNQAWSGVGLQFTVNSAISVTSIGIWDDGGDGFLAATATNPLSAYLMTTTGTVLISDTFYNVSPGGTPQNGGYRFKDLVSPVLLSPGDYFLMGYGWNSNDQEHNSNQGGTPDTFVASPLVSFVQSAWTFPDSLAPAGTLPTAFGLTNFFSSANIQFDDAATPLPAALPLFATGLGALGLLGWRRKRKQVA
jgi:hypothetical protein